MDAEGKYRAGATVTGSAIYPAPRPFPERVLTGRALTAVGLERTQSSSADTVQPGILQAVSRDASKNLDFLRASAVLFVLAAHLLAFHNHLAAFGHRLGLFGVLLFFIHTSLVLLDSLRRQAEKTGDGRLFYRFMTRRAFRIYPASVAVVALVWLFRFPVAFVHPGFFSASRMTISELVTNLLLVQNIARKESILGTLWSLPYEMNMYLLLPALYAWAKKQKTSNHLALLTLVISCAQYAFIAWRGQIPGLTYYVPFMLLGAVVFTRRETVRPNMPFVTLPLALAVGLGVLCAKVLNGLELGICLMIALTIPHITELSKGRLSRLAHIIAKYSYGIYLLHFLAMWTAFQALRHFPVALQWASFVVLLSGSTLLLFHCLEDPMIRLGRWLTEQQGGQRDNNHTSAKKPVLVA